MTSGDRMPLRRGGSVVLDAGGNGTVTIFPDTGWQTWEVERVTVRTNQGATQTPYPQAELFVDLAPVASSSRGATASGQNDVFDASGGPIRVGSADGLTIAWTGGVPGSIATVTVTGTMSGGRGGVG